MTSTERVDRAAQGAGSGTPATAVLRSPSRRWELLFNPVGRFGTWFIALWLFLLVSPFVEGWGHRHELRGVVGMVSTVLFGALYIALWFRYRAVPTRTTERVPPQWSLPYIFGLVALGALTIGCVGEPGLVCTAYVGMAAALVFSLAVSVPIVIALVVGTLALGGINGWANVLPLAFAVMAAALAVYGLRAVIVRNRALSGAHRENARLAVDNERSRFARDLHDILGHSLTVITIKAELAQKLLNVDVERARTELIDLERLSRDAMADVRRAVQGYRDITLPGELVRARTALRTAEIQADLPSAADDVPSDLRELFAWTVREGVTNVIRHSGATRCAVRLTRTSAEVIDDGAGDPLSSDGHGSGLAGLRERAAAVGATVVTRELSPGFSLYVGRR